MEVSTLISIGELLDKYSILEIKSEMIDDMDKLKYIKDEMNALENDVFKYKNLYNLYYTFLKDINKTIWDLSDEIRANPQNTKACLDIIYHNDRRFRVKNKINVCSLIKEQKAYPKKKVYFFGHRETGDTINCIGIVRYLSTCYDMVRVCTKASNVKLCETLYSDDPQIEIVIDETPQYCMYDNNLKYYNNLKRTMPDWEILSSYHFGTTSPLYNFPYIKFYDGMYLQLNIEPKYRYLYNFIPRDKEKELNILKKFIPDGKEYIFIHNKLNNFPIEKYSEEFANKFIFSVGYNYEKREIDKESNSINILDYSTMIENCTEFHVDDSSFFCLANYLDMSKVKKLVVYRYHLKYDIEGYINHNQNWTII